MNMNFEHEQKMRTIKVIISEIVMVLSVLLVVGVLILIVSGYWVNEEFEVERQGMIQVSSIPTGATVIVDGVASSWFERTNMSKIITNGEHTVTVTRNGYDSWTKTIEVSEGLLYRLHYPRLFLQERIKEKTLSNLEATKVKVSPKRDYLLVTDADGVMGLVNLNSDIPEVKKMTEVQVDELLHDWETFYKNEELYDKKGNIILKFYEDKYLVMVKENKIIVVKKDTNEELVNAEISFTPKVKEIGHNGEFIAFSNGNKLATLDMESMEVIEWTVESEDFYWIDNDMIGVVDDGGKLIVYDYDGLNRREITNGIDAKLPVMITDDRWLYYFSLDGVLMREIL